MSGSSMERSRYWREYSESLVKRGELYLTLSFLENWDRDPEKINREKLVSIQAINKQDLFNVSMQDETSENRCSS